MGDKTGIEWTEATWNPVTGCDQVSAGCDHCYAETIAKRFAGTKAYPDGFAVTLHPQRLDQPLRWRRPRRIFVNSMSDLFHHRISDEYIAQIFAVMALASQHTYQILTKRHARMHHLLNSETFYADVYAQLQTIYGHTTTKIPVDDRGRAERWSWGGTRVPGTLPAPLPNVWMGVSVENQQWADIRIPALLDTPAAVRFISAEPLLGPIDLVAALAKWVPPHDHPAWGPPDKSVRGRRPEVTSQLHTYDVLHWVIAGGESGRGARPMHPWWAEKLHRQCQQAEIPFLFKQWGEWTPMAPLDKQGRFDFSKGVAMTDDGNIYQRGELDYPDGPRRGEAVRADFPHHHPTSMYRVGKKNAGRELYHDGRTFDEYPDAGL